MIFFCEIRCSLFAHRYILLSIPVARTLNRPSKSVILLSFWNISFLSIGLASPLLHGATFSLLLNFWYGGSRNSLISHNLCSIISNSSDTLGSFRQAVRPTLGLCIAQPLSFLILLSSFIIGFLPLTILYTIVYVLFSIVWYASTTCCLVIPLRSN